MDGKYLVIKSNYFIMNSSYDLSLEEQKIILTLASMVQPTDEEFKPYKFKISEFIELLGLETQTKYTEIPKITKELMKKVFEIREGSKVIQVAWLSSAEYENGSGMVELEFSPKLKPYMLQLKERFTQYQLKNVLSMKSKYSPRMYEILKCNEYKRNEYIEVGVGDLRKLLKSEFIYPKYNDFKKYVLERSQKELEKSSDLLFDFEEVKTSRKITSIRFYIKTNNLKAIESAPNINKRPNKNIDENQEIEENIKSVLKILKGHKIRNEDAVAIYENSNGNLERIKEVYEYSTTQKLRSFIGFMRYMVLPGAFQKSMSTSKVDPFNDYTQRTNIDFKKLEREYHGWGKEEDLKEAITE